MRVCSHLVVSYPSYPSHKMWFPGFRKFLAFILSLLWCSGYVESTYYWESYAAVNIEYSGQNSNDYLERSYTGDFASYARESEVRGDLWIIDDSRFGCNGNASWDYSLRDARDRIVLLELTDACSDYVQSVAVEETGAVGVVFYTSSDRSLSSKPSGANSVSITVALVMTNDDIANTFRNLRPAPQVQISEEHRRVTASSRTFYFVVFAFCILMGLSCLWFILSYIRRCCHSARRRQRQVRMVWCRMAPLHSILT